MGPGMAAQTRLSATGPMSLSSTSVEEPAQSRTPTAPPSASLLGRRVLRDDPAPRDLLLQPEAGYACSLIFERQLPFRRHAPSAA